MIIQKDGASLFGGLIRIALLVLLSGAATATPQPDSLSDAERSQIRRAYKESVREGHLNHNLKNHFLFFDRNTTFVFGRSKHPDDHDVTRSARQQREFLKRRWRAQPTGHENVFFRSVKVQNTDGIITLNAQLALHNFGAIEHTASSIQLHRIKGQFKATHVRTWTVFQALGGATEYFTPAYWSERDDDAFNAVMSSKSKWRSVLTRALAARWYHLIHAYLDDLSRVRSEDAEVWKAHAAVAYILGDFKLADRASRKAKRLNPDIDLPPAIR